MFDSQNFVVEMKVLFCSPYLQDKGVHKGGINIWANNILSYYKALDNPGIHITPVSFDREHFINEDTGFIKRMYWGILDLLGAVCEASREIKAHHYDCIHICTSASISLLKDLMLLNLARKCNVKSVVHLHFGRTPQLIKSRNWEWKLLRMVLCKADSVIVMDKRTYETLDFLGYSHIYYCPNPLSIAIMNQVESEQVTVKRQSNKLLFIGHVIPTKGVFELVEACMEIPDVELHVIGKAQDSIITDLKRIAQDKDNGNWLVLRGELPHTEVLRELLSATIFVFPSYTEGFPNVILEAMACGCPIAASSVGAIPEMLDVENDPCGVCYAPRDVKAVKDSICDLLVPGSIRNQLADKAKYRVYREYGISSVWERLVNIWKK